jgi:hypothetical protein
MELGYPWQVALAGQEQTGNMGSMLPAHPAFLLQRYRAGLVAG